MRAFFQYELFLPLWFWTPFLIVGCIIVYAVLVFRSQATSTIDKGKDTTAHSERIYKDFEMYLKVNLGLVAGIGYSQITAVKNLSKWELGNVQLMVGAVSLLVMTTFSIFIISHQGSKIRRWKVVDLKRAVYWQELWACVSIWLFSSGFWWYCWKTI